jgi:hypothetical protein
MAAAAAMQGGPGLFNEPPMLGYPVSAGLKIGPGPGPEIMRAAPLAPSFYQQLATATGDDYFANLAQKYGLK